MTQIEAFGVLYGAGDVRVTLLNRTLEGISKLKYGSKQEKKNLMGLGREPVGRGHGGSTYESSITLKSFEMDALQKTAPNGDITKIKPFPVYITYLDTNSSAIKKDQLVFAEFTGDTREIKVGDVEVETECELIIGGIKRNI